MKKIYGLLLAVLTIAGVKAQHETQLNHFMFDRLSVNPGYAGMGGSICGGLFFRRQWDGFDGNSAIPPTSVLFNANANLDDFTASSLPLGVGLSYLNDKQETMSFHQVRVSFAYQLKLGNPKNKISFGLSWGILNSTIQNNWIYPDGTIAGRNDQALPESGVGVSSTGFADLGFGVYWQQDKEAWAGVSGVRLAGDALSFASEGKDINFDNARHLYVMGGYNYDLQKRKGYGESVLRFSAQVKTDFAKYQPDVNVNYLWKQMLWFGASWRDGMVEPMIGYQNNTMLGGKGGLKVGYSYGLPYNELKNSGTYGGHELFVTFCYKIINDKVERHRHTIRPVPRY